MDILERRVTEALSLILEAAEISEQGTAQGWEVAKLYARAAALLQVSHAACLERARGNWSCGIERNAEGRVVRLWIGSRGEVRRGGGGAGDDY